MAMAAGPGLCRLITPLAVISRCRADAPTPPLQRGEDRARAPHLVLVEHPEHESGEPRRIALREELLINVDEPLK